MAESLPARESAIWQDWIYFLRAYKVVIERVSQELADKQLPTLIEYSVLYGLYHAEGHRSRLVDLSKNVLVSKSRVTRLMNSLVAEGYVRREQAFADKRVTYAVLTDEGQEAFLRASPTFVEAFDNYFRSQIGGREGQLRRLLEAMATQVEPMPARWPPVNA
jgi:DNA-binding MarR family transcriptional regulator